MSKTKARDPDHPTCYLAFLPLPPLRITHSPRSTAPYHTDEPAPSLTFPSTLALAATNAVLCLLGTTTSLIFSVRAAAGGAGTTWPALTGTSGLRCTGANARLGWTARSKQNEARMRLTCSSTPTVLQTHRGP